jgi:hypothetical protein
MKIFAFYNNLTKFATKNMVIFYCLTMNCSCVKNISYLKAPLTNVATATSVYSKFNQKSIIASALNLNLIYNNVYIR